MRSFRSAGAWYSGFMAFGSEPGDDDADTKPAGRPGRDLRRGVVKYIGDFVHTAEQLASLACLLKLNETTLRRWLREDAPSVIAPPQSADAPALGGFIEVKHLPPGILGDVLHRLHEQQTSLIIRTLRDAMPDMTFGDLQTVLNSGLGRILTDIRVQTLIGTEAPTPSAPTGGPYIEPLLERVSTGAKIFESQRRNAAPSPTSVPTPGEPHATVPASIDLDNAILSYLREHPGWHPSKDIRPHASGSQTQYYEAITRLRCTGVIDRRGAGRRTEYSLKVDGGVAVEAPMVAKPAVQDVHTATVLKTLRDAKEALAPGEIKRITRCTQSQFNRIIRSLQDSGEVVMVGKPPRPAYALVTAVEAKDINQKVFEALRDTPGTGGTMTVPELRSVTKLNDEQVRRALHNLIEAGQIDREGSGTRRRFGLRSDLAAVAVPTKSSM